MLATAAYDSPDASYTFSLQDSRAALEKAGFKTSYALLTGNCHVDDARNSIVRDFLDSECTDLVFLDADVAWNPADLVKLCKHDADIVGGVYPFRRRNDRAIAPAMPVLSLKHVREVREDGLLEVEGLPTGFLRIRRGVLEKLSKGSEWFQNKGPEMPLIFERTVENGNRYGGDITFCRKWRDLGGKVFADPEIRLGHVAKQVLWGSLGESLRKQEGTTLTHVVSKIRDGSYVISDFTEAWDYIGNLFGAHEDILAASVGLAKKADKPILEIGSGLSTVLMAAATDQTVYCVEHDPWYARQTELLALNAGVKNIGICTAPLKDGWYDLEEMDGLPSEFSFALLDGPPRALGDRMRFFDHFDIATVLADDADDLAYREKLENSDYEMTMIGDRTALLRGVTNGTHLQVS